VLSCWPLYNLQPYMDGNMLTMTYEFTVYVGRKEFKDRKKFEGKEKRQRCVLNDFTSVNHFGYGTVNDSKIITYLFIYFMK